MRTLLFFLLTSLFTQGFSQEYYFEQVSPESGFAFDAVYTISEDCNGFIWFGCNNGLYYYNTSKVEKTEIRLDTKVLNGQSIKINTILNDNQCNLWVCSKIGLFVLRKGRNSFEEIELSYENKTITNTEFKYILQWNDTSYVVSNEEQLYYFSTREYELKKIEDKNGELKGRVTYIGKDEFGNLLVGDIEGNVYISRGLSTPLNLLYESKKAYVTTICSTDKFYYVGFNGHGVDLININGNKIRSLDVESSGENKLPDNRVRQIIKRDNGDLWIGTYKGILIINSEQNTIINERNCNGLTHNSIYTLYQGKDDGIWIGTWAGGIAYYNEFNYRFKHITKFSNELQKNKTVISIFAEDKNKNIWIGSDESGLREFNPENLQFIDNPGFLESENFRIKSFITQDGEIYWIGTFSDGIWNLNSKYKRLAKIENPSLNSQSSSLALIDSVLWIGTRGQGIIKYHILNDSTEKLGYETIDPNNFQYNWIWKLYVDSSKNLWISTDNGLYVKPYKSQEIQKCSISGNGNETEEIMIYTVCKDADNLVWLGTKGMGVIVCDPVNYSRKEISNLSAMEGYDIYSIIRDRNNDMWFATDNGIKKFNKQTGEIIEFSEIDGLSGNQFNPNASCVSSDGKLYFGAPNGFCIINPDIIKNNTIEPEVFLSKILINNSPYETEADKAISPFRLAEVRELSLQHNQNSIIFSFVANNFVKPEKNRFRYRLLNYQDNWVEVDHGDDIAFTKIPPGEYTLEVFGSNNDGLWNKTPLKIDILIIPPIWKRWYAHLLYFLLLSIIIFIVIKEIALRLKYRREFLAERYKNEANETLYTEKLKFFTNISHEFRTPLTLVLSPLSNLLAKYKHDPDTTDHLNVIKRNADRILRLTNQVLDFRLLDLEKLKPNFKKSDIVEICSNVYSCFELQIVEKDINFVLKSSQKILSCAVDPDMIEKIVYNLISNAIKFSPDKGQIILSIETKVLEEGDYQSILYSGNKFVGNSIEIKVVDFGKGISAEMLPHVFERFSKAQDENETGTGIGLHLCQEYARLNMGNIMVNSKNGRGSTFILNIPIEFDPDLINDNFVKQYHESKTSSESNYLNAIVARENDNQKVVLIAEDNDELRLYLRNSLKKRYKVITAKNGKQALEIAQEVMPDIIITDILMPGINGIELTHALKNNFKTNLIPIIVLTAFGESNYHIESVMKGADSFLTKPIDEKLLIAQIENILINRNIIEKHLNIDKKQENNDSLQQKGSFIEMAEKSVEKNLQNPEFSIGDFAANLNLSKSTLNRKIKQYTNQNPSEFIRDIRLKNAIALMKLGKFNIDEIGVYVGFNSTSYFIRSFKKKYGKTPKEFKKQY